MGIKSHRAHPFFMKIHASQTGPQNHSIFIDDKQVASGLSFDEADKAVRIGHLIAEACGKKVELSNENLTFYQKRIDS